MFIWSLTWCIHEYHLIVRYTKNKQQNAGVKHAKDLHPMWGEGVGAAPSRLMPQKPVNR